MYQSLAHQADEKSIIYYLFPGHTKKSRITICVWAISVFLPILQLCMMVSVCDFILALWPLINFLFQAPFMLLDLIYTTKITTAIYHTQPYPRKPIYQHFSCA